MNQECTTATTDTAQSIRRMFEGCGWTVEGLPDDLTPEQGVRLLEDFLRKLEAATA